MRFLAGHYVLDAIDWKILRILQEDARTTMTEIAKKVNRSRVTVHYRLTSMEEAGIISKYTAVIDVDLICGGMKG